MFSHYPDIMSVNDLRSALGIGRTKAYELIKSGEIKSIKVGKSIKIPKAALLDYIWQSRYNTIEADKRRYHEGGFS
jgi:excisionase family DNA binding protein